MKKIIAISMLVAGAFILGQNWSKILWEINVLNHHGLHSPMEETQKLAGESDNSYHIIEGLGVVVHKSNGATTGGTLIAGNYSAHLSNSGVQVSDADELSLFITQKNGLYTLNYNTVENGELSGVLFDYGMDGIPDRRAFIKNGFEEQWDGNKWVKHLSKSEENANK